MPGEWDTEELFDLWPRMGPVVRKPAVPRPDNHGRFGVCLKSERAPKTRGAFEGAGFWALPVAAKAPFDTQAKARCLYALGDNPVMLF